MLFHCSNFPYVFEHWHLHMTSLSFDKGKAIICRIFLKDKPQYVFNWRSSLVLTQENINSWYYFVLTLIKSVCSCKIFQAKVHGCLHDGEAISHFSDYEYRWDAFEVRGKISSHPEKIRRQASKVYIYIYMCMFTSFSSLSTLAWLRWSHMCEITWGGYISGWGKNL